MKARSQEVVLSGRKLSGVVELAAGNDPLESDLLRRLFGDKLPDVLAVDPEPMILLATDILDKGDVRNGKQTWVFGEYLDWITQEQFLNEMAPAFRDAQGFANHRQPNEWSQPLWTVKLMTLGGAQNTPSAYLYVDPAQADLRKSIRCAVAEGTLGRKYPLSLHLFRDLNWETGQVQKWLTPERWSLDVVRRQGTKSARIDQAVALAAGAEEMLQFESMSELLGHPDVKSAVAQQVAAALADPATRREIALAASDELVLEHKAVAPLKARLERPEVVQSLKPAELEVALSASPELRQTAATLIETLNAKTTAFRTKARELLLAEGLDERTVEITLGNPALDLSHCDEARVTEMAKGVKEIMLATGGSAGGVTTKPADAKPVSEADVEKQVAAKLARMERGL